MRRLRRPGAWQVALTSSIGMAAIVAVAGCSGGAGRPQSAAAPSSADTSEASHATAEPRAVMTPAVDFPEGRMLAPGEESAYVGSESCAECHSAVHASFAASPHADTLSREISPAVRRAFDTKQTLADASQGTLYSFTASKTGAQLELFRGADGATMSASPSYVVGSGRHGYTFLFEKDGEFLESRTSYFTPEGRWNWTPGQEKSDPARHPLGRSLDAKTARECFLCHSTSVVEENGRIRTDQTRFNVGCERCHGPGKQHVEEAKAGKGTGSIYALTGLKGVRAVEMCGQCHRPPMPDLPESVTKDPLLPRFSGTAFSFSECFRKSEGRFTCVSCHDPHHERSRVAADYDRVCTGCHTPSRPAALKLCPVNSQDKCVSCHMPLKVPDPRNGMKFHNHWIRVHPESARTAQGH